MTIRAPHLQNLARSIELHASLLQAQMGKGAKSRMKAMVEKAKDDSVVENAAFTNMLAEIREAVQTELQSRESNKVLPRDMMILLGGTEGPEQMKVDLQDAGLEQAMVPVEQVGIDPSEAPPLP